MKRLILAFVIALVATALAAQAQADPSEYGIENVTASLSTQQAGGHPDFNTFFRLKLDPEGELPATTRNSFIDLPPGLLANPTVAPTCSAAQLLGTDVDDPSNNTGCPQDSQVGVTEVFLTAGSGFVPFVEPVFNMEPRFGEPARLGFIADIYPVMVDAELRPDHEYAVRAKVEGISSLVPLLSADTTIWGVPADQSHDSERVTPHEAIYNAGVPEAPGGKRPSSLAPTPYTLNPTRCGMAQAVNISATPYALPDLHSEALAPLPANTGCPLLDFEPSLSIAPTTSQAETGSGLNVELTFPSDGLQHPNLLGEAEQRRVEVALPEGVSVNPSQAVGLGVCSEADFARETASSGPNEGCPETSKIGSVNARSPLLNEQAEGALYIATPKQNPFGTLIAVYLVLKIPDRGVIVALAGKVTPDPKTGQLIATFGEAPYEIPQLPVSSFELHFREGARSPLITPPSCGTYASTATFTSWAGQTVTTHPSFQITRGVNGGSCPSGTLPFEPGFEAGSLNDTAGGFSPFDMHLTRRDGDQDLTKFSATLPPGMVAKLAGVTNCSDASIALARGKSGKEELASPSCPASSEIGRVTAGAGVGSVLVYATGNLYLAGPYQGAPLSVAAIVPAVAGPFDVGTVVTRVALQIDPRTAVVNIDGAHSDPIPHILAGIPLKVRDIRVAADRPDFTLNPTSCARFQVGAQLWGGGNDVFSTADDSPVSLADGFQVANCASLGFKPRLRLKLTGGTKRGAHPALKGVYEPRSGDTNLKGLVVRFPHSAFLDQAHIRTICTRVQFAAKSCPPGSIYGHARVITPLLDQPLEGPVYLRSSSHNLPDFVAALHGLVDVEAVAKIDSKKGGIRATFTEIPDVPLSKVTISLRSGSRGLIVNSTDICHGRHRADAQLEAHNGKRLEIHPEMSNAACRSSHKRHHSEH